MKYVKESFTSYQGAVDNLPKRGTQKYAVLQAIGCGDGLTRDEIEVVTKLAGNAVRPRVAELIEAGLVKETERTRKTRSGSQAAVLVVNVGVGAEEERAAVARDADERAPGALLLASQQNRSTDSGVETKHPSPAPFGGAESAPPELIHHIPSAYDPWES